MECGSQGSRASSRPRSSALLEPEAASHVAAPNASARPAAEQAGGWGGVPSAGFLWEGLQGCRGRGTASGRPPDAARTAKSSGQSCGSLRPLGSQPRLRTLHPTARRAPSWCLLQKQAQPLLFPLSETNQFSVSFLVANFTVQRVNYRKNLRRFLLSSKGWVLSQTWR